MPERNRGYLREQRLKSIKKRHRLIKDQKNIPDGILESGLMNLNLNLVYWQKVIMVG